MSVDLLAEALLPGGWQWNRFLMGRPWGEVLVQEGVTSLSLIVVNRQLCLQVTTAASPQPRFITWHGAKCRLSQ